MSISHSQPHQQNIYYCSLSKTDIFANPRAYAWNCLLYYIQFTQSELLLARTYVDIVNMIKYQKCLTRRFVHEYFADDIENCDMLSWEDVNHYVQVE
jgi:hypothetical protein